VTSEVSSLEILSRTQDQGASPDSDSDKALAIKDVSTDGEELYSPTQATQELIPDFAEAKASEPKVAVITPKVSSKAKNPSPMKLDGKTILKPLKKRHRIEVSQSTMT
jgi:hypothetical protein